MISGNNYTENRNNIDTSYFFSKFGHIWGWATWKRVWDKYDYKMRDWPIFRETKQLSNIFSRAKERNFFYNYFDSVYSNIQNITTWDQQWFYCRIKEYGLSIVPQYNLVTNIGVQGTHSDKKSSAHFISTNENYKIVKEPKFVLCNTYYDKHHFKQVINKRRSLLNKILRKIVRIVKRKLL